MTTTSDQTAGGVSVECRELWKVYGPKPLQYVERARELAPAAVEGDREHVAAVRDVSFKVVPGETFVVMGLSGSGKSTLVRCLTRLIEPTAGEVRIDGRLVSTMSQAELRHMRRHDCAMVFQHFGLLPHRRVIDNVAYGLQVAGLPRSKRQARAEEVLSLVGLSGWESKYPAQLSGGMRQRVGLARALATGPRLLLLDEPFSALDPLIRRELQDELVRLASVVKQTSVFITHDIAEAIKLGDRIAIMRDGQIVQIGTPEEIVLKPADDYVRKFVENASRLQVVRSRTVARPGLGVAESASAGEVLARARCEGQSVAYVLDNLGRPLGTLAVDAQLSAGDLSRSAGEVMTRNVPRVQESDVLEDLMNVLVASDGHVAVVDANGAFVGEVDEKAVLRALLVGASPAQPMRVAG